jgi:hypothetical protein
MFSGQGPARDPATGSGLRYGPSLHLEIEKPNLMFDLVSAKFRHQIPPHKSEASCPSKEVRADGSFASS